MTAMRDTSWIRRSHPDAARALRGVPPETEVRFDVIPGSLFAFLSAALAPIGKAALDKAS